MQVGMRCMRRPTHTTECIIFSSVLFTRWYEWRCVLCHAARQPTQQHTRIHMVRQSKSLGISLRCHGQREPPACKPPEGRGGSVAFTCMHARQKKIIQLNARVLAHPRPPYITGATQRPPPSSASSCSLRMVGGASAGAGSGGTSPPSMLNPTKTPRALVSGSS
jgi:hypothetical protein